MNCTCGVTITFCPLCGKSLCVTQKQISSEDNNNNRGNNTMMNRFQSEMNYLTTYADDTKMHEENNSFITTNNNSSMWLTKSLPCKHITAFELFCVRKARESILNDISNNPNCSNSCYTVNNMLTITNEEKRREWAEQWLRADDNTRHNYEVEAAEWSLLWKDNTENETTDAGIATTHNIDKTIKTTITESRNNININQYNIKQSTSELTEKNNANGTTSVTDSFANKLIRESVQKAMLSNEEYKRQRHHEKINNNNNNYYYNNNSIKHSELHICNNNKYSSVKQSYQKQRQELSKRRKREAKRNVAKCLDLESLEVINSYSVFCRIMKGQLLRSEERSAIWRHMSEAEKAPFDEAAARLRTKQYMKEFNQKKKVKK